METRSLLGKELALTDVKGRIGALLRLGEVNDQQEGGDSKRGEGLPGVDGKSGHGTWSPQGS